MNRNQLITFYVKTPGGLKIPYHKDDWPKPLDDIFRNVDYTEAMVSEAAVAYLSRLTGLPCEIKREITVWCDGNTQTCLKR